MIDFATLQGVTIPEGVVTQIESGGVVLWKLDTGGGAVVLEVEKITSDTYAGETTYTGESFILLDVYPKTNGTVSVTYGGLTKTVTDTSGAAEPNAQQVYFGTFNGVSDSVATPASGELTIKGDFVAFGHGSYSYSSKYTHRCICITNVVSFGNVEYIPAGAFSGESMQAKGAKISSICIPGSVRSIGDQAFGYCTLLPNIEMPDSVESIGKSAFVECDSFTNIKIPPRVTVVSDSLFSNCGNLQNVDMPNGVTSIGADAFINCSSLTAITIPAFVSEIGKKAFYGCENLATVTSLPATPPTLDSDAELFHGSNNIPTIIVPKGSGNAYKNATHWSTYADYIVEAS